MRVALDEIIKFNCEANEFNFMQEVYARFKTDLMFAKTKQRTAQWMELFAAIDANSDGLLSKSEL